MTTVDFIKKWQNSLNHLGLPSIGIHVSWDRISPESKIQSFFGQDAWEMLLDCRPPWFKEPKTFSYLMEFKDLDYKQILKEETENGKIEYYRKNGLREPNFCIFSTENGKFKLLGDGNHRLFDCLYLLTEENKNFKKDISKTAMDIIYLSNFEEVVLPKEIIWSNWKSSDYV